MSSRRPRPPTGPRPASSLGLAALDVGVDLVRPLGMAARDGPFAPGLRERFLGRLLALGGLVVERLRLLARLAGFDAAFLCPPLGAAAGGEDGDRDENERADDDQHDDPRIHCDELPSFPVSLS